MDSSLTIDEHINSNVKRVKKFSSADIKEVHNITHYGVIHGINS